MKTTYWIALLAGLVLLCGGLGLYLMSPGEPASYAEIRSQGILIRTVSLQTEQTFTVSTPDGGENTLRVHDGKIAVIDASCPDHYCMQRGYCAGGTPIVCLPNQLVIQFTASQELDAAVG